MAGHIQIMPRETNADRTKARLAVPAPARKRTRCCNNVVFRCRNEAVASFQMVHPACRNSDHKTTNQRLFVGLHTHFYSDTFHYSLRSFCAVQLPTCRSSRLLSVLRRQLAPSTLLHITPLSRPKSNKLTSLALSRATNGPPQQDNLTDRC